MSHQAELARLAGRPMTGIDAHADKAVRKAYEQERQRLETQNSRAAAASTNRSETIYDTIGTVAKHEPLRTHPSKTPPKTTPPDTTLVRASTRESLAEKAANDDSRARTSIAQRVIGFTERVKAFAGSTIKRTVPDTQALGTVARDTRQTAATDKILIDQAKQAQLTKGRVKASKPSWGKSVPAGAAVEASVVASYAIQPPPKKPKQLTPAPRESWVETIQQQPVSQGSYPTKPL